MKAIFKNPLYLAWLISLIGLIASLFIGEVLHNTPCALCWYQRIALFPLAVLLGIGAYESDRKIFRYAFPFVVFGSLIAFYQTLIQWFPSLEIHAVCGYGHDCSTPVFALLGFITFPFLSFLGFLAIGILLYQSRSGSID